MQLNVRKTNATAAAASRNRLRGSEKSHTATLRTVMRVAPQQEKLEEKLEMFTSRALEPAGSPGILSNADPLIQQMDAMVDEGGREGLLKVQLREPREIGTLGAIANACGDAMRSMAMDPVSATRQTLATVRRHPYVAAVLLLGFGAIIADFARS